MPAYFFPQVSMLSSACLAGDEPRVSGPGGAAALPVHPQGKLRLPEAAGAPAAGKGNVDAERNVSVPRGAR